MRFAYFPINRRYIEGEIERQHERDRNRERETERERDSLYLRAYLGTSSENLTHI